MTASELLAQFMEENRPDYSAYAIYMVDEQDVEAGKTRSADDWLRFFGYDMIANVDAAIVGLGDVLFVVKDRYREVPFHYHGDDGPA
jgi:hypothetical protein